MALSSESTSESTSESGRRSGDVVCGRARTEAHRRFEANTPLIRHVLGRRFPFLLGGGADGREQDAWAAGALGLLTACERFDPARGVSFGTFAYHGIYGAVSHWLRGEGGHGGDIRLPAHVQQTGRRVDGACRLLRERLGRDPEAGEVAAALGVTEARVSAALSARERARTQSLDARTGDGDALGERVEDRAAERPGQALLSQAGFAALLAPLTEKQRRVVEGLYRDEDSAAEVAARLGVTAGRVQQLHKSALERLRRAAA